MFLNWSRLKLYLKVDINCQMQVINYGKFWSIRPLAILLSYKNQFFYVSGNILVDFSHLVSNISIILQRKYLFLHIFENNGNFQDLFFIISKASMVSIKLLCRLILFYDIIYFISYYLYSFFFSVAIANQYSQILAPQISPLFVGTFVLFLKHRRHYGKFCRLMS